MLGAVAVAEKHIALIYIYIYLFQYIYIYVYLFIYVSERVLGADLLELRMPRSHGSHLLVIFF